MVASTLITSLLVGAAVLVILAISIMRHIGNRWMEVVTVDADGKQVGKSEWVRIPRPDRFRQNGMSHVDAYVTRLTESPAAYTSLSIFSPDGHRGFGLDKKDGRVSVGLIIDWRKEPERETAVREFFKKRDIDPVCDYLTANGNTPEATRILDYPVSGDGHAIADLCRKLLQDVYAISEHQGLNFTYEEYEQPAESSCTRCQIR